MASSARCVGTGRRSPRALSPRRLFLSVLRDFMDLLKIKDLKDLQAVLDLMRRNDLAELEIEEEGQRIRLRKTEPRVGPERVVYAAELGAGVAAGVSPSTGTAGSFAGAAAADDSEELYVVTSPLVGTFYRAPSPEADPFIQVGDRVDDDAVLAIVEAMKVMNEIRTGVAGIVRDVLVKNGEAVEYGQPLFRLEPV
jgi:acetyl-CoA carboxylase biotin carboxyl carrier protein